MLARIFGKPPCKLKSTLLHFVLGETLGRYELSGKLRLLLPEMKLDALILLKFNVERRPGGAVSLQLWFRIFTITRGLSTATSLGLCHLVNQSGHARFNGVLSPFRVQTMHPARFRLHGQKNIS